MFLLVHMMFSASTSTGGVCVCVTCCYLLGSGCFLPSLYLYVILTRSTGILLSLYSTSVTSCKYVYIRLIFVEFVARSLLGNRQW